MTLEEVIWIKNLVSYIIHDVRITFPDIETYPNTCIMDRKGTITVPSKLGVMWKLMMKDRDKLHGFLDAHVEH
jgi:hypothetical protein